MRFREGAGAGREAHDNDCGDRNCKGPQALSGPLESKPGTGRHCNNQPGQGECKFEHCFPSDIQVNIRLCGDLKCRYRRAILNFRGLIAGESGLRFPHCVI
jgi:hypothetical protein